MGCSGCKTYKKAVNEELKKYFNSLKLNSAQEKEIKNLINQDLNKKTAELKNKHYIYREEDAKQASEEYKKIIKEKFNLENKPLTDDKSQEENENKYKNLKVNASIEMIWKMKESNIAKIYELSNNRIAVIKREHYDFKEELKIYSLNTFKLLLEIKFKEKTKNMVELKNKDLVRAMSSSIEFYKISGQKCELFQKIEEKEINIYFILGLMDGNLVPFNTNGIEIYSKKKMNINLYPKLI